MNDVTVKSSITNYNKAQIMKSVKQFVFEHLINLHDTLISIELIEACVNINKSQFSMSDIKIVNYVCDSDDMHLKTVKIVKIVD